MTQSETNPSETKPGETKPGETEPGETEPGETEPNGENRSFKKLQNGLKDYYPLIVIGLGVLLIGVSGFSCFDWSDGPDKWLTDWTAWVTNYVALAVAAYSIVKLANGAEKLMINWHLRNKQ